MTTFYERWLKLPAAPKNYYQLLGLPKFSDDMAVIERAVRGATSRLNELKPRVAQLPNEAPERTAWQQIAKQITAARKCLLDADAKRRYDEKLGSRTHASSATEPSANSAAPPLPVDSNGQTVADLMAPVEFDVGAPSPTDSRPKESKVLEPPPIIVTDSGVAGVTPGDSAKPDLAAVSADRSSSVATKVRQSRAYGATPAAYAIIALLLLGMFGAFVLVLQQWVFSDAQLARSSAPFRSSDLPLPSDADDLRTDLGRPTPKPDLAGLDASDDGRGQDESPSSSAAAVADEMPTPAVEPVSLPLASDSDSPTIRMNVSDEDARGQESSEEGDSGAGTTSDGAASPMVSVDQLRSRLTEARELLKRRAFDEARQITLEVMELAQGSELADPSRRLDTIADYSQQYWQAYEESLKSLQGIDLRVGRRPVHVVDVGRQSLTVRDRGESRTFAFAELPLDYVMAIAARGFNSSSPSTGVFRGAFMWATGEFDPSEVRQAWQLAKLAGADLDDLPSILDDSFEEP